MKRTSWSAGLSVSADGVGVVAHAGSVGLRLLADRTGLTTELSMAMVRRSFTPVHDRGRVLVDVAVMLADGGWRDRWIASGADADWTSWIATRHGNDHRAPRTVHQIAVEGLRTLVVSRVILPGWQFFSRWKTKAYRQIIEQQDTALVAQMNAHADQTNMSGRRLRDAWAVLGKMMLHTGEDLPDLTAEDIFALRAHYQAHHDSPAPGLGATWMLLAGVGILPKGSSLRAALRPGQRSVAYLVDRYGVAHGPVRDLLIRYLEERKTGVDYTTLKSLARMLVGNFWTDLERHHPRDGDRADAGLVSAARRPCCRG